MYIFCTYMYIFCRYMCIYVHISKSFVHVYIYCTCQFLYNSYTMCNFEVVNILNISGVGKSFVIKMLSMWAEKILRKEGQNPNYPRVLLAAPTGKAASIIGNFYFHKICGKFIPNFIFS